MMKVELLSNPTHLWNPRDNKQRYLQHWEQEVVVFREQQANRQHAYQSSGDLQRRVGVRVSVMIRLMLM